MSRMRSLTRLATVILITMPGLAAAAAPPQLRGKSVVVSWNESRMQRDLGVGNFHPVAARQVMSIYVSGSGRVFSRMTISTRAGTGSGDQVEGQTPPQSPARVPSFAGRSMTMFQPFRSGGMRRLIVEFDPDFATCTARSSYARAAGAQTSIAGSVISKKTVEIQSITSSGETCSVRSGNVFGSE